MNASDFVDLLPDREVLKRRCQALAVLDAILCPEWEYRYFSFNAAWAENEMLSLMRNGEGDDWLIHFSPRGVIIKGYVLSAKMSENCPWPGVVDQVPSDFDDFMNESAFSTDKTTFCLWRNGEDSNWKVGPVEFPGDDPDGTGTLLPFLDGNPQTYQKWGEEYFGTRINPRAIEHIYQHDPLNPFIVRTLNQEVRLDQLRTEIEEIGFPL